MSAACASENHLIRRDDHLHAIAGEDRDRALNRHAFGIDVDRIQPAAPAATEIAPGTAPLFSVGIRAKRRVT